jgi:uncharacterized coiled-coil protein SlyX
MINYKKWTHILIGLVVFLVAGLVWQFQSYDQSEVAIKVQKEKMRNQAIQETFLKLLAADEALLSGIDPETIRETLLELETTDSLALFDKLMIERRISYLDSWMEAQAQGDSSIGHLSVVLQRTTHERDTLIKRLNLLVGNLTDVENTWQTNRAALEQQIAEKDRQLTRKEKIRVITFNSITGKKIHYLGEVEDGKANGNGIGIWANGSLYRGGWRNNMRHGEGEFEWPDGDKYAGEFANGQIEGEGTYYWKSGERYEGTFTNNRRNGSGILFDQDGNIKFKGQWKDDKPQ